MRFTKENAAEMAKRSHAPESARYKIPEPEPEPQPITQSAKEDAEFIQRRIARTRLQIDKLCTLIDDEDDPQALDRYAAALSRLSTLEREYAMRPAPGTLKPTAPPKPTREKPAPVALPPVDPPQ